jgi:hypothetical protein
MRLVPKCGRQNVCLSALATALTTNPTLTVEVKREPEYYQQQSKLFARFLALVANMVAPSWASERSSPRLARRSRGSSTATG